LQGTAELACRLAESLPAADLADLGAAVARGRVGLLALRARAASPVVRGACDDLLAAGASSGERRGEDRLGPDRMGERRLDDGGQGDAWLAGALAGAAAAVGRASRAQSIEVIWTGPESDIDTSRLTAPALVALVGEARRELMVVSYATHDEPRIAQAFRAAAGRGVDITLITERSTDNTLYRGAGDAFAGLRARRLAWPAQARPPGAALHAKLIVVDARIALVSSANLTGRAMADNLECGVVIRGGPQPAAIRDHLWSLYLCGKLETVTEIG
jgi:phosphatidylserine/phosphatidylglycerophosphate/cardiolipin synthase-like enzyme